MEKKYYIEMNSLSDKVYHYIKDLILSGELKGEENIAEQMIADRFGVSRTPVREALSRLNEYGLIDIQPRKQVKVCILPPDQAKNVALLRASIEELAVRQICDNGNDEDFDYLEEIDNECCNLFKKKKIGEVFEKDSQFHLEIAKRSGNPHLYEISKKIDAKVQLLRLVLKLSLEDCGSLLKQHKKIIKALRNRNQKRAVQLISNHILYQIDLAKENSSNSHQGFVNR